MDDLDVLFLHSRKRGEYITVNCDGKKWIDKTAEINASDGRWLF